MHDPLFRYRMLLMGIWSAWLAIWVISAVFAKRTARAESAFSRWAYVAPLLIGACLIAVPLRDQGLLSVPLLPIGTARYQVAVALTLLGLGFSVWARVHIGRNWSGTVTVKAGHELVRTGPYAYVRHPIYTGVLVALLGSVIACGELRGLLGYALIAFSFVRKLRVEERFMRAEFPADYPLYCETVPALVPFTAARRSGPH
jgi:protein-S-isoprenylcysteine O-methyltransferase Ste14